MIRPRSELLGLPYSARPLEDEQYQAHVDRWYAAREPIVDREGDECDCGDCA